MKSTGYSRESRVTTMYYIIPLGMKIELSTGCRIIGVALNPSISNFS